MSTFTPNFNLEKPDSTDDFKDFRSNYNSNMDIIDQNLGGGGSSVSWSQLQVTGDKLATITVSGIPQDVFAPNSQTFTMAVSRANINSGETYSTIFGKIKKWFNDLKTVAFSGSYNDLSDQPTIPTATSELNNDSDFVSDASYVHTDNNFTNADVTKLSGIQSGAEVNVQSDWNEVDNTADDYIKNKPTIPTVNDGTLTIQQNGATVGTFTANQSGNTIVNLTGGGGSAHTIVNESGTSLADEPNLQFTDGLKATDDSVNSKTVVGVNTTFTEASTRANIASGESFATILGKIKKFFTDLKTVAFSGSYNDLTDKPTIPDISTKVSKSGDTMNGNLKIDLRNGTTLSTAYSTVTLGNNIPSGTDKNSFGVVRLYGENQAYTDLYAPNTTTQNRDITFPNKNGTVALTSDVDDKVSKSGDTLTGELDIRRPTGVDAQYRSTNTTNGYQISFGWGSGGTNRGIWDTQFAKWIFRSTGTDVTVNGSTVPANKTLASTDQIPTDFVSKTNGGTFNNAVTVNASSNTPFRNQTSSSGNCYLEFSNTNGYLGWFSVNTSKRPCFMSASDNTDRELALIADLNRLTNYYSSRPSSANIQLGDGTVRYFVATSSMSTGKPTTDAHILHLAWDNSGGWDGQLALPTDINAHMQWRNQNNGSWGSWRTIIDSNGGTVENDLTISGNILYLLDSLLMFKDALTGKTYAIHRPTGSLSTNRDVYFPNKGGTIAFTSDISSRRYKENIIPLSEDEAKKILDVEIVNYDYKENVVDEDERYDQKGAIAEDVVNLIPNAVTYADIDGEQLPDGINYTKFIPYLIKMVQMQQKEIEELKAMIKGE